MKLKTALGTIMTLALILIVGATNIKTAFAKQEVLINVDSTYMGDGLLEKFKGFKPKGHMLKGLEVTPKNGGVKVFHDEGFGLFYIDFNKIGKYDVKFTFTNGKSKAGVLNVSDLVKDGKALKYRFEKDKKGNDIFIAENLTNKSLSNVDIKLGKKINIKGAIIPGDNVFIYSFKKGFLKKNKFNIKDKNKIKYKVAGDEYIMSMGIQDYKVKGDFVSEIKLGEAYNGCEGYVTLVRLDEPGTPGKTVFDAVETIKVNKGDNNKWIKLREKFSPDYIEWFNVGLRIIE